MNQNQSNEMWSVTLDPPTTYNGSITIMLPTNPLNAGHGDAQGSTDGAQIPLIDLTSPDDTGEDPVGNPVQPEDPGYAQSYTESDQMLAEMPLEIDERGGDDEDDESASTSGTGPFHFSADEDLNSLFTYYRSRSGDDDYVNFIDFVHFVFHDSQDGRSLSMLALPDSTFRNRAEDYFLITQPSSSLQTLHPVATQTPQPIGKDVASQTSTHHQQDCSICLVSLGDDESTIAMTCCRHFFHRSCLDNWIRRVATCPLCRFAMTHYHLGHEAAIVRVTNRHTILSNEFYDEIEMSYLTIAEQLQRPVIPFYEDVFLRECAVLRNAESNTSSVDIVMFILNTFPILWQGI